MEVSCEYVDYKSTGSFSKLVTDYIDGAPGLKDLFSFNPTIEGVKAAIANRSKIKTDRPALVQHLKLQYSNLQVTGKVASNLNLLLKENTFTVCTAHQPNIFTGHLYFIYKILHVVKIADHLQKELPDLNFVPVFYMGNEDADLEELGHIFIDQQKYEWKTKQTGAVGKMIVDTELIKLIDSVSGQVGVSPFGNGITELIRSCYVKGLSLQEATLRFVHQLFESFGLVILIPDSAELKSSMSQIFEDDLFNHSGLQIVEATNEKIKGSYKPQAHARDINLFYIEDQVRNRIIQNNGGFEIENTAIHFTAAEIRKALTDHPEKFSPNVILRGLYQETILPNVVFVGGGGELAYWLQLNDLFKFYHVAYPVLVLRNSFLIIQKNLAQLQQKLKIDTASLFKKYDVLVNELVTSISTHNFSLEAEKEQLSALYKKLQADVKSIDSSLEAHVTSLAKRAIEKLEGVEKKMLRAEKRKFSEQQQQIKKLKTLLFPFDGLQERIENVIPFYAKWGPAFLQDVYQNSLTFEQRFAVLEEK